MISRRKSASTILNVAILLGLSLGAQANDSPSKVEATTSKTAIETFKSILGDAKLKGLVKPKGNHSGRDDLQPEEDRKNTPIIDMENVSVDCSDLEVLDLSDLENIENYTYLDVMSATDLDQTLTKARRYLALGLGVEARNMVSARSDIESKILKIAGAALDGISGYTLKEYSHCGISGELWAVLGQPSIKIPTRSDSDLRVIIDQLREMPPHLMEILAAQYAIASMRSNEPRNARAIWGLLEDNAALAQRPSPDNRTGDYNILFLRALLNEQMNAELSRTIYQHLSARDSNYSLRAMERLQALRKVDGFAAYSESSNIASSELDIKSLAHHYSGQPMGREANLLLIKIEIQSRNLISAMEVTRREFQMQDHEFAIASALVAPVVLDDLNKTTFSVRMQALDVYLSDREFFDYSGLALDLTRDAGLAASQMGYPDLAQLVYLGKEHKYASNIVEAKAFEDLLNGKNVPEANIPSNQTLIMRSIDQALAAGDGAKAGRLLPRLENEGQRKTYKELISWIDSAWGSITTKEGSVPVIKLLSSPANNVLSPNNMTSETISEIALKTDSDVAIGAEYITNG